MLIKLKKLLKRIFSIIKELGVERDVYLGNIYDRKARPSIIPQWVGEGMWRIPLRVTGKRKEEEIEVDYNIQITRYEDFCTILNYCARTDVWVPSGKQWKRVSEVRQEAERTKELFESQGYKAKITEVDRRRE